MSKKVRNVSSMSVRTSNQNVRYPRTILPKSGIKEEIKDVIGKAGDAENPGDIILE